MNSALSFLREQLGKAFARVDDALSTRRPCPRCGTETTPASSLQANYPLLLKQPYPALHHLAFRLSLCPSCFEDELLEWTLSTMHPGRAREELFVRKHCDRAYERGLAATLTIEQWMLTLKKYNWHCAYCGGPYEALEHILPIYHGGGTTAENCVPACDFCNRLKASRHPDRLIKSLEGIRRIWRPERR